MKVHTQCDRLDQLFEMMCDQVFIFGSSLFAALRGSDYLTEKNKKHVHDLDFLSLQRVNNPRSFAARTRELPQYLQEWDGVTPMTPYVTDREGYLAVSNTGSISRSFPQGLPTVEVVEILLGCTAEEVVMFSHIDFLHRFWDGKGIPKIRYPQAVQRGENTRKIVVGDFHGISHHLRKWSWKATKGLCTLNITYGKV